MERRDDDQSLVRWRLVLGRFAEKNLPFAQLRGRASRLERALDYLYQREYAGRGVREREKRGGTLDPSQLNVPQWLGEVRELFPRETVEVVQRHALDRYGMTELISDPQVLEKLTPNMDLLKMVLTFRGLMKGEVLNAARRIVREVVEELKRKLESEVRRTLWGRLNRFRHSPMRVAQNFDWRQTIRRNLKHYDPERGRLVPQELRFFSRVERRLPWDVILCVDQSGSMAGSVIHSAVMAGILSALPSLRVHLVAFDTSVVDLTGYVDDPVEVLMSVQLGGGTDIGGALAYCEGLVTNPHRTVMILVSDFAEGASPARLLTTCGRMREAGVRLLGLAALDEAANPSYDIHMAEQLAARGMEIAALTPGRLAEWLAKAIS
ncbi:MAG TPA: VWA domain-containing protein [Pyrinomonadaceae bacterium]|jgi:Mg-chelatase subunit ChlD|nr:VWA domain-containing protein [Pyrinomonadaceae bacterium]